jgi:hypothetical protein
MSDEVKIELVAGSMNVSVQRGEFKFENNAKNLSYFSYGAELGLLVKNERARAAFQELFEPGEVYEISFKRVPSEKKED